MRKAFLNWSSGKDSALALYAIQQSEEFDIAMLVTSINAETNKISMHGVSIELLKSQAAQIGIPLHTLNIPTEFSKEKYDEFMRKRLLGFKSEGYTHSIFGDIFLEDLKDYRETKLKEVGLKGVFPLWKKNTKDLMETFLDSGFHAICVCTNSKYLSKDFCGRKIDRSFLNDLPENVDPCGENGEFHTFVYDGPIFKNSVSFKTGEVYKKSYDSLEKEKNWDTEFYYCELLSV
ncbi:diphthine--ammonia ligase [Gramella sp. AN32]|uniref:Diphthine--ammonia ligase n=1 Tax=Christiangramia antarctica TaxID=2058158 RepID=A0ABW5X5K2_9FLAO|nr:diphthine--ammonia ligase [Gramella sp. AN32]MCM4158013.1 diphthine--ammonia ligase [Gramella sp. AN32]